MTRSFFNKLVCPFDKADLSIKIIQENQKEIVEGILTCTQCHRYYPIVQGIPIMSPDEYREIKFEIPLLEKWNERPLPKNGLPTFELDGQRQIG